MKRCFYIFFLVTAVIFSFGCPFASFSISPASISQIEMKIQSGLGGASADITLRRNETSEFRCNFYRTDEEDLREDSMQVTIIEPCGKLYKNNRNSFKKNKNQYGDEFIEGVFKTDVSSEQFDKLAKLIVENGYFSMADSYEIPGLMDAPPTITRVVYSGGEKKISNQGGKGSEKLSEIQKAIYNTVSEADWK